MEDPRKPRAYIELHTTTLASENARKGGPEQERGVRRMAPNNPCCGQVQGDH
jgi:hypothetical protein